MRKEININLENDKSVSFKYYKIIKENKIAFVIKTKIYDLYSEGNFIVHIKQLKKITEEIDFAENELVEDLVIELLYRILGRKISVKLYKDKIYDKIYSTGQKLINHENEEIFVTDLFRKVLGEN